MDIFPKIQIEILKALCEYKQLTVPQLDRLFQSTYKAQTIRRHLSRLSSGKRPLVNKVEFKKIAHFGTLSSVHSITVLGVKLLEKSLERKIEGQLFTPKKPRLTDDYFHRTRTIDFHILIKSRQSCENYEVLFCKEYFVVHKIVNSFVSINRIMLKASHHIIPDLVLKISDGNKNRLLLFELHNGNDKRRIKEQIKEHALTLIGLYAHRKYTIDSKRFYYILILFEEESTFKAVINDISKDTWYRNIAQFFLCKHLKNCEESFLYDWTNLSGKSSKIQF